jgi:hypothetical protein
LARRRGKVSEKNLKHGIREVENTRTPNWITLRKITKLNSLMLFLRVLAPKVRVKGAKQAKIE